MRASSNGIFLTFFHTGVSSLGRNFVLQFVHGVG